MLKKNLRLVFGYVLILLIVPPVSVGVFNIFVLLPALVGLTVLFLPQIKKLLLKISGAHYRLAAQCIMGVTVAAVVFFAAEFAVIFAGSFSQRTPEQSVAVVLGAGVYKTAPSILLQGRIDAAGRFLKSSPESVCIAAGGQGPGEDISEGECIKKALIAQYGIDEKRIYVDASSSNTVQNFENTLKIIKENNLPRTVAVVTDGFHMYRARMIAARQGLKAYACPADTDSRLAPTFYLRELFALPKSMILDR